MKIKVSEKVKINNFVQRSAKKMCQNIHKATHNIIHFLKKTKGAF